MIKVKETTNCQVCDDCLRMFDYTEIHNPNPKINYSKCYGQTMHTTSSGLKRKICDGLPPKKSPERCPHRHR